MTDYMEPQNGGVDCNSNSANTTEHSSTHYEPASHHTDINQTQDNKNDEQSLMKNDNGQEKNVSSFQYSGDGCSENCDKCGQCLTNGSQIRKGSSDVLRNAMDGADCQSGHVEEIISDIIPMVKGQSLSLNWQKPRNCDTVVPQSDAVEKRQCLSHSDDDKKERSDAEKCDDLKLRYDKASCQINEEEEKKEDESGDEDSNVSDSDDEDSDYAGDAEKFDCIFVCGGKKLMVWTPNASSEGSKTRTENQKSEGGNGDGKLQDSDSGNDTGEQSFSAPLEKGSEGHSDTEMSICNTETVEAHVQISNQNITGEVSDVSSENEITGEDMVDFPDEEEWQQIIEEANKPEPLYEVGPLSQASCAICFEESLLNLRPCCRTPVCDSCMTTYLETLIASGMVQIQCPGICQKKYVPRVEIVGRISLEMKEKYHKFLIDANNEANVKTCPRCSHVMNLDLVELRNPKVKKRGLPVTCPQCDLYWCFPCQAPWHYGITCKEHRKGDKLLRKWAKEESDRQANAQRCPKCKIFIQRISGCEHMTCSKCGTSFCYRCGERYCRLKFFGDHFSRYSIFGCKYIYKADQPLQRKLIRGSLFGTRVLVAPVVGALAVTGGVLLLTSALLFYLPCYGVKKIRKMRSEAKQRRHIIEERRRWEAKRNEIRNMGDPYIEQFNRYKALGVNPYRVNVPRHEEIEVDVTNLPSMRSSSV